MDYNITLTANHQSLTAKYLPLAAESVQYLTAKVVYETDDWTGREIKAMFEHGRTVYKVSVIDGEITAKQQLNLTAGDWRVWLVGNSARDGDVIPRITTNVAHISVAPTGGTEGNPFPATPPTVEEQLRADMGNLADLTTEDKSSLVAAINEAAASGGSEDAVTYTPQTLTEEQKSQARTNIGAGQSDWNQNDETQPDYIKNRPFYTGDPVETILVEESTVSFAENHGLYVAQIQSSFAPTAGETYKVYWDGAAYECICVNSNNQMVIGNLSIVGAGPDTGEPFLIVKKRSGTIAIGTADASASHTVSISGIVQEVVKIDPKYIRDMYYTGDPVETVLVEESTVSFAAEGGMYVGLLESTFSATAGETYKVYWDGAAYECTCTNLRGDLLAIGNLSIAGAGSDTGEPFVMGIFNGEGIDIATQNTSASHTVSISGFVSEVVKIDEKYLPEYSVLYSGDPANWSNAKKQQMYDDFISGKILFYRMLPDDGISIVLSVFYSRTIGLQFVFFESYHSLRSFHANAFSNPIDLSESGINNLIHAYINTLRMWELYSANASEVSVGDLLSMYVAFDSTTNKACILTNTKGDKGSTQLKSTIVTNGDADIILSSSTADSTKKFKITVDDSGEPTITDESDSTNTWKPTNLPTVTTSDAGKFLRVSDTGEWVAETILSASGVSF